ncbi:helix-turn-helix domain-containing protein [Paenibacillus sp. HB172176]|uniref:helix-turn-helix domain-containing protein n=1 Tax=Paenibacillus sp. HB172176 TaxID=2493690 RepID=UPI00143B76A5|nr:helix-turn-helix domain-containing protein [Paenibacillus sp. HB172176]
MWYKYLFSNLLVFALPVLLFGVLLYQYALSSLMNVIEDTGIQSLNQVRNMTDMRMSELKNISARISADPDLSPYMIKSDGFHTREAVRKLGEYKDNSIIIDEIYLYFRGDNYIYSSEGSNELTTLSKYFYKFDGADERQFLQMLDTVESPVIKSYENVVVGNAEARLLTYLYPIPPAVSYTNGAVMYVIKESMLNNLIDDILGNLKGNVYIFDSDNHVLVSKNKEAGILIDEVRSRLGDDGGAKQVQYFKINGDNYSLMKVTSDASHWTFVTLIPTDQFLGEVSHVKWIMGICFVVVLVVGLSVILYISRYQYRPIRELTEHVRRVWSHTAQRGKPSNELERIRDTIDDVVREHQGLVKQIDTHRPLLIEQFLHRLLRGSLKNHNEADMFIQSQQMQISEGFCFVMYITFGAGTDEKASPRKKSDVLNLVSDFQWPDGHGYGIELIEERAIALIASAKATGGSEKRQQEAAAIEVRNRLKQELSASFMIGIGRAYEHMTDMNQSFIEASAAAGYRLAGKSRNWIFFDEIAEGEENNLWYPIQEQVKLAQSLRQGDREVAQETLSSILRSIDEKVQSLLLIKLTCMDVINTVFKMINELNLTDNVMDLKKLVHFNSLQELHDELRGLVDQICDQAARMKEEQSASLKHGIISFIHEQYTSIDISLDRIAEHFDLSASNLSRLIKEQTGESFTDYIGNLRLKYIKKQLKETDTPIKTIIADAGYLDVSSFIRKFKGIEGVTPGQYRKSHQMG